LEELTELEIRNRLRQLTSAQELLVADGRFHTALIYEAEIAKLQRLMYHEIDDPEDE
jgi:hypothetical protein